MAMAAGQAAEKKMCDPPVLPWTVSHATAQQRRFNHSSRLKLKSIPDGVWSPTQSVKPNKVNQCTWVCLCVCACVYVRVRVCFFRSWTLRPNVFTCLIFSGLVWLRCRWCLRPPLISLLCRAKQLAGFSSQIMCVYSGPKARKPHKLPRTSVNMVSAQP